MPSIIAEYWKPTNILALMLDYDGTLTPIVPDPTQAFLPEKGLELLRKLCRHPQIYVAIVSGRSVPQLRYFLHALAGEDITWCGLHGGEIYLPQSDQFLRQPQREQLQVQLQPLREQVLGQLTAENLLDLGVFIEDKTDSLAVHYRQAQVPIKHRLIELMYCLFASDIPLTAPFKLQPGKEVLEILPHTFDKGNCVAFLWNLWQVQQGCYIGDDVTDEAAFAVVNARGGLSIAVGKTPGTTQAQYICSEVADVYEVLVALGS
ncbi:trehalose-phosphatase [Gloeomargarita lithophora]